MPDGIAWWVEPIRAKASAWSLSFLGTWRNSANAEFFVKPEPVNERLVLGDIVGGGKNGFAVRI